MAVRKTNAQKNSNSRKKTSGKIQGKGGRHDRVPVQVVFFLFLFIALITAFFVLLPRVSTGLRLPQREAIAVQEALQPQVQQEPPPPSLQQQPSLQEPSPSQMRPLPPQEPSQQQPAPPQEMPPLPEGKPMEQQPAIPLVQPPVQPFPETRDRGIYFMLDREGAELVLTPVNRSLIASQTPLLDCISALLAGPSAEERRRNLATFIPEGSRILTARIIGNTAELNFNEEFRYNTLGREGCIAQLQQVVWTATEFPNIHNVQILIGGNRVDFLSEGIPIGTPLRR